MMVGFVLAEMKDVEILRDISLRAFADDLKRYGELPPGIESLKWHEIKVKTGMYYKIVAEEKIIGGINLYNYGQGHFCLGAIFIEPEYQNRGIGAKAIEFIEKTYQQAKKWTLDTPYLNTANHRFYERHGYKKVGEQQPQKGVEFYLFLYEKVVG